MEIEFSAGRLFLCEGGLKQRGFFDWDVKEKPHPMKEDFFIFVCSFEILREVQTR